MDIPATQAATQKAASPKTEQTTETGSSALTSDFNTFLTMLTAQMKNQDPLNPIDSADYAVQLATFSGVEQQVQTNDLLRALGAGSALGGLADHASWVGMQARVQGPINFEGAPVDVYFETPLDAVSAEIVVYSPNGQELHRRAVDGASPYSWDGLAPSGTPLLAGAYDLTLETRTATGRVESTPVSTYSRVTEVRATADGPQVVLSSGAVVAASDVSALRGS